MGIARSSFKQRVVGVVMAAAVCILAFAGPAGAVPPASGGGGTGTKVAVPATESDGLFSLPGNLYLTVAVLAGALLALSVYRRFRRSAVASS